MSTPRASFVNMRDPRFLHTLGASGFTVVAPWTDPAWDDKNAQAQHTAYRCYDNAEVVVADWTITYRPEFPADWEGHPDAFRALRMLGYRCTQPSGPVSVRMFQLNTLFFSVDRKWMNDFYHGRRTVEDFLLFLERRTGDPTGP